MAPIYSRMLSSCQRLLAAILLLCSSHAAVIAAESSSWCSSSFEGEPQQQITMPDEVNEIVVMWLRDESQSAIYDGCGQSPRATWNIEPAPEGVNSTQIWMSPPDLGRAPFKAGAQLWGIVVNETFIDNNIEANDTNTEIGVLIQVPKDHLMSVRVNSPLRVNISPGFTKLAQLRVAGGILQNVDRGNNYTCGTSSAPDAGNQNQLSLGGLGAEVRADLSTVERDISLSVFGRDGNDIAVKLPEDGYPLTDMSLEGRNSRYYIKGNINCTNQFGLSKCSFRGGSADLCKEDCFSQLVIDGEIDGNITVPSYLQSAVVSVANVSARSECERFVPENPAIFACTDGAPANTTVEVEPLPCTMQEEGMTLADVVECPTHYSVSGYGFGNFCNCYVPTSETCPEQPSPASFGALLSKTVSFGLTGVLCYAFSMLVL